MTTARKRWWRAAAIAAVGGVAVTGGYFGLVRAKSDPAAVAVPAEITDWTAATPPAPSVAEVVRAPEPAPPTGPVTPASATLPPLPTMGPAPVVVAPPIAPPVIVPAAPVPGPRIPDLALTGGEASALPAVPPVPSLPPAELPALPTPPRTPEVKSLAPPTAPTLPPLPMSTAEPPKAAPPLPPSPAGATVLQPPPLAPTAPPVKPAGPMQPMIPAKPDYSLQPANPANTLNPTVAPASPIQPGGRDVPALPVDRSKPPQPPFEPTPRDVFPVKPTVTAPHQRDDTMLNLTTTAAMAFLGGALAAEKTSFPPVAPPAAVIPAPTVPLKADDKSDPVQLRKDLDAANKKVEDLEKQVKRLTELLTGKREAGVLVDPNAPGAVDDVKALKDKVAALERELSALKTQTALRPAIAPEAKPRGVVKVVNEYPVEISMVINEKSYRIAPNTKLDVEIPAGDFSYQLLQSGVAATKSVIKDKETVTLRIK